MTINLGPGEDIQLVLERQARDLQAKAAELTSALNSAGATVSSPDGSVSVTLDANGGLRDLKLGHRACELGPARLTAEIMAAVTKAQRQTARNVVTSFEAVTGETESTEFLRTFLPADPEQEAEQQAQAAVTDEFQLADDEPRRPVAPPPTRPSRPAPRRRPVAPDDDDEDLSSW